MSVSTALSAVGTVLATIALGLAASNLFFNKSEWEHRSNALYAAGNWALFLGALLEGNRIGAVFFGAIAILFTWLWWRNRRNRRGRKALRELGAKSRARIQALVDQMTPSPVPSPTGGRS